MKKIKLILFFIIVFGSGLFAQNFYDINTINDIEITFEESNWDYLLDELAAAGDEERLIGSVTINGQFFDSVGVRYKGNSSYNANQIKNPLNIKLDYIFNDQEIEGYGTIKLANVYRDPSFVREVLSYEIARNYMPAGQSNFANVYINGQHLGLYTSDQDVDKFFMRTNFQSDENARIKGEISGNSPPGQMGGVWEYFGSDSSLYYSKYALESDFGWQELVWFIDTLNNFTSDVDQVLNIDRHLWFLAFENMLVNLDGPINNPQNYYMYKDDAGRFNPIPWDLNESFGVFTMLQTQGPLSTTQLQQLDPFVNLYESEYPIIGKILSNTTYRKMYVAHMKTMLEEQFSNSAYEQRALEIQNIIDSDVQADNNKFYTYNDFNNNLYNSIGGGPQAIVGIVQLMDARADYLSGLAEFQLEGPEIVSASHSPEQVSPQSEVWFTTEVNNAGQVWLATQSSLNTPFVKKLMYDDGAHEDGAAGDGVFGVNLTVGSTSLKYYIYAENEDASAFLPARAEYEFFEINITGSLVINEFMADNESTVTDQDGDYDDWIELYNNGSETINLGGYYLSDDATEPDLWAFPDTTIAVGEYIIVWADKDEDQEGLHADLKLSASGETIVLSDPNLNLIDQVNFGQQKADTTTGRFANGTGDFIEMLPTFGTENTDLLTGINDLAQDANLFILKQNYPNPFSNSTNIEFEITKSSFVTLTISNMYGNPIQVLVSETLKAGNYRYQWNASGLAAGLYLYQLEVDNQVIVRKMALN